MYQLLRKVALTGIKSEAPPAPDDALRVARQRLEEAILTRLVR